jgi:hypothetical protein
LAWRLTAILLKLNQGARVIPDELAAESGVHVRTIRRDLSERFAFVPLEKDGKGFRRDAAYQGHLACWRRCRFEPNADRRLSHGKRAVCGVRLECRRVPTGSRGKSVAWLKSASVHPTSTNEIN